MWWRTKLEPGCWNAPSPVNFINGLQFIKTPGCSDKYVLMSCWDWLSNRNTHDVYFQLFVFIFNCLFCDFIN